MMQNRNIKIAEELQPPPRWLHCPRKGNIIADKFLPFKTPLDDKYNEKIPEACSFTPQMLITMLTKCKAKIGLWIDLTNTNRFYHHNIVESYGIKYLKLACKGHASCPSRDQTKVFVEVCQTYISKNPMDIIGVHCTHGFNRTGFLIVAYLVESLSWSVDAAINEFSLSRSPGIYKQDYLAELFERYGDPGDTITAPPLPDWCYEEDNVNDDGQVVHRAEGSGSERKMLHRKRREFNKKNPEFMEGVPGVTPLVDPEEIGRVQRTCQEMCGWKSSGFPGLQPVSMDLENLKLIHMKPYKVSWKADGTRYMMLILGENMVYFIDRDNSVFRVSQLTFPKRKAPDQHICNTLLDGEMIIDKVNDVDVPRYLVYDIVLFEGQEVGKTDFDRRLLCIDKEIINTRRMMMAGGKIDRSLEPFSVRQKQFWDITQARQLLGEKFNKNMSHEVDGLIFQPCPDIYVPGRCPHVLKWKPPELNSVDFRLEITRLEGTGILPKPIGCLYLGRCPQPFDTIKVTKAIKNLNSKIIECKYHNNEWVFLRERTDKSFPNSFETAMGVCKSIKHPVTKDILFDFIDRKRWMPPAKELPSNSE